MGNARPRESWFATLRPLYAPAGLLLYTLLFFGPALFFTSDDVMSGLDIRYFATSREFGFGELRSGHLALWNPYMFSGSPFLANFQSALLYPPNLIYLALPLSKALNIEMALHMWLLGVFMYAWARYRNLCPIAAFFSALLLMSSGAFFAHVRAGHLSVTDAWAWTPLIFLAMDRLLSKPSLAWSLVGIAAVTMQILAGHPQCVFLTGFALALYCLFQLPGQSQRLSKIPALASVAVAPLFLSAAQLWPGIALAGECTRAGGSGYAFSASHSFPPENLMGLVVDGFFGRSYGANQHWWGRSYDQETAVFAGMTGVLLALFGAVYGKGRTRWTLVSLAVLTTFLALGSYTPVFRFAYTWVPGFDHFRAPARLSFYATMFVALLAAMGTDRLLRRPRMSELKLTAGAGLAITALVAAAGLWIGRASTVNLRGLALTAGLGVSLSALFWLAARGRRWAPWGILILGAMELGVYVNGYWTVTPLSALHDETLASFASQHPGDYRILDGNDSSKNRLMHHRMQDLWGYDPVKLRRYSQFMEFIGGPIPEDAREDFPALKRPLAALLRGRYSLRMEGNIPRFTEIATPLPHFYLVNDYRVVAENDVLSAMAEPSFDPRRTVLLEREPEPLPARGEPRGQVNLVGGSTDHWELDVNAPEPTILVITDAYSDGWRARPVADGAQSTYDVLPADYVVRAIPLAAGRHRIRVEYSPAAFRVGTWASLVSCGMFAVAVWLWTRRRFAAGIRTLSAT